jgi:DNA-binding transcriptional LysR family regulator
MELRHLRYFVAVAETENVTRAALKLHVSQPALSRQIRDLEEELGFPLLERGAKSVRLTEAGRTFLTESRAVLQRTQEAVSAARAVSAGGRGELHVGYAPSPTVRILPPTLRAFQAQRPLVRVRLHDLTTDEMVAGVREGKLQIAFLVKPSRTMLRNLRFEALTEDPVCVAVPPQHEFARMTSVGVDQVLREPLLVFTRREYPEYHELLESLFGLPAKPRIAEEHDSATSLIAAVEAGCGVAVVARSLGCSVGTRLHLVPLAPAPAPLLVGAVWLPNGVSAACESFLACARKAAAQSR